MPKAKGNQVPKKDKANSTAAAKRTPNKKSKHTPATPSTADEYLAAGVDFEEAGEKWRAGDAAKSARFFIRAIDCYNEALGKFPDSFDLAYNLSRVQYELTQYPKLLAQVPGSLPDLLRIALVSSRYALKLNPENPEVIFNTAQILSSIAEAQDSSIQPMSLLDESLILFDKCLAIQEQQIEQYKSDTAFFAGPEGDRFRAEADAKAKAEAETASLDPTPTTSSGPQGEKDERWVFILEPATNDTLLDTILAKLETLTLFTSLLPPSPPAPVWANIHNSASSILNTRITTYTANTSPERKLEATLLHASYNCAFAEAQFKSSLISPSTYFDQVCSNYQFLSSLKPDDRALCDSADSYIAFNDAVRISMKKGGGGEYELVMRWKALSQALTNLTSVSEKPVVDTDRLVVIHLSRGDVEILRWQLGQAGLAVAKQYGTVLLGNAEKFYRGALRFSTGMGAMQEKAEEAKLKEAYAKALQGDGQQEEFKELLGSREKYIIEMAQEGLLEDEQLKYFGIEAQD